MKMRRFFRIHVLTCAIILTAAALVSCVDSRDAENASTGTLGISLIDSPNPYKAIYVTINQVQVHHEIDGWEALTGLDLDLPRTVNLLDLVNGAMAYLGSTELATGHYNQMRLILADGEGAPQSGDLNILGNEHPFFNYLIDSGDNEIFLKVPSGGNTGIKLVNGFDIEAGGATDLVLDFDAMKSVVQAGNSGKWLLKPTIKVVDTVVNTVSGTVVDEADNMELEGAAVSAQKYSPQSDLTDEANRVTVAAGTESDGQGRYFMYLPLLSPTDSPYNIVVTKEDYEPACRQLPSNETAAYTADFALNAVSGAETGTFSGSVAGLAGADDSAVFSIRQEHGECGIIEVASVSVVNTMPSEPDRIYSDPVILPAGKYQIVVSADGRETQVEDLDLQAGQDYLLDVDF